MKISLQKIVLLLVTWSLGFAACQKQSIAPKQEVIFGDGWKLISKTMTDVNHELRYSIEGTYPQIENPSDPRALKLNSEIKDLIAKRYNSMTDPIQSRERWRDLPKDERMDTANFAYEVIFASDELLSIRFLETSYTVGSAHPSQDFFSLNYELRSGRVLNFNALFKPNTDYLEKMEKLCEDELHKLGKELISPTALALELKQFDNWNVNQKGLIINFDRCAVTACVDGELTFVIPYDELKDILNQDNAASRVMTQSPSNNSLDQRANPEAFFYEAGSFVEANAAQSTQPLSRLE